MILSGEEIKKQQELGGLCITPFDESRVNPNSYNFTLGDYLLVYDEEVLDMKKENKYHLVRIPPEGLLLEPGRIYLGQTVEHTYTPNYVPMLEGRSSIGRLGLFVHVSAGFGDIRFKGHWTLELSCIQPIRIYAGVEICQGFYHTIEGDTSMGYTNGKYSDNNGVQASKLYKDFVKEILG